MKKKILFLSMLVANIAYAAPEANQEKEKNGDKPVFVENSQMDKGYPKYINSKPVSNEIIQKIKESEKNSNHATYQVIDNSIPGKWQVETKTILHKINGKSPDENARVVKMFQEEYCLTAEDIENSKFKKITEKLSLGEMFCSVNYESTASTQANIKVSCLDESEDKAENGKLSKFKSQISVEGTITTLPKYSNLYLSYSIENTKDGEGTSDANFTTTAISKYMGSCSELEDVTNVAASKK